MLGAAQMAASYLPQGAVAFFQVRQGVGGEVDAVAGHQLLAAHGGSHGDFYFGPAEKIHHQKGLALLGAIGKKDNCFAHKNYLLCKKPLRLALCGSSPHGRTAAEGG